MKLLEILLKDRTTQKNIIWATDDYKKFGKDFSADKEIKFEQVHLIKPRFLKSSQNKKSRVRDKAEVFTPAWVCNQQNNLIDETYFGRANVFNKIVDEKNHTWQATSEKISFNENLTWQSYVGANRLEITCGEAPYLVSRYDTVSGVNIPVENRIGLLDRKLRVVFENTFTKSDWLNWAEKAVQSVYGYEFQGDSLLLARQNIFMTYIESYQKNFNDEFPPQDSLEKIAEIISWNLWQMDGLTNAIPYYQPSNKNSVMSNLFEPDNVYCKVKDWKEDKVLEFRNIFSGAHR